MAFLGDMCVSAGLPMGERNTASHRKPSVSSSLASKSLGEGELAIGLLQYPQKSLGQSLA